MLIVGSEAMHKIVPSRVPNDLDIIIPYDRIEKVVKMFANGEVMKQDENVVIIKEAGGRRVELLLARPGNAWWMYLERYKAIDAFKTIDLQGLYSMKKSHAHIPIKFEKHVLDYGILNKMVGGRDIMPEITKQNTKDITDRLKQLGKNLMTPSLNKTVKEFFAQSEGRVNSFFVHDHIHEVMSHYDRPLYERMQKDLTMARCEKDLWEKFSYEDKMRCVLEEAYVIALERKILPVLYGGEKPYFSPLESIKWSMMRVCTTLTSGWFRRFATDNYAEIMAFADMDYVSKFLKCVDTGKIQFLKKKEHCEMAMVA